MNTFSEYIPNSSSKISVFQSPEEMKDKIVDHTVVQSKPNTNPMLQHLTELGGGEKGS
jgi:hypothetical protein